MEPNVNLNTRTLLDTLAKIGVPRETVTTLERYVSRDAQIRGNDFKVEKQNAELATLRADVLDELRGHITREEEAATVRRDQDLQQVDRDLAAAKALPTRDPLDTGADWSAKLIRRQIEEQRDLMAVTAAAADVSLALAIDDPAELEAIVTEALESGHPEHVRRVSRAVQLRLGKLATAEMAAKITPGSPRPASQAAHRVDGSLREWRARESAKSPAVRKQRIADSHQVRVREIRDTVGRAAGQFQLREALEAGLAGAHRFTHRVETR